MKYSKKTCTTVFLFRCNKDYKGIFWTLFAFLHYLLKWLHHILTFPKNNSMMSFWSRYGYRTFRLQKVKRYNFQRILVFGTIDTYTSFLRINPPQYVIQKTLKGEYLLTTLDFSFSLCWKNCTKIEENVFKH